MNFQQYSIFQLAWYHTKFDGFITARTILFSPWFSPLPLQLVDTIRNTEAVEEKRMSTYMMHL